MIESELSVWDWLVRQWKTPRWKRAIRLILAAIFAAVGAAYLAALPGRQLAAAVRAFPGVPDPRIADRGCG
jgi:uncharacterized membrane protein YfcA